ncbi:Crp/Fnr family transcriptional regulator [Levilactobacillus bambusae]|nr:Crp/Fnr family transcriptional regulator [Levilactobacillus bambusae]
MIDQRDYSTYIEKMRTESEFAQLPSNEFDQLLARVKVRSYPKGQILFDQGDRRDRFYYLLDGIVRVERFDMTGEASFYEYVAQDHAFPYRGFFMDDDYAYSVRAMTTIVVASFAMGQIEELISKNPAMMKAVLIEMGTIISEDEDHLQHMITSSASDRVQYSIRLLGQKLGQVNEEGHLFVAYPVNINELAEISATTRETASSVIAKLQDDGVLNYSHKRMTFYHV